MNRFVFFVRNNILAFLIFIVLVASVFFAWYFIHPSSPFQKKQSFVIFFNKIGFLQKGNLVRVNGIQKGEIRKIELLEEGVLVTARIFADYEIPVNSEFRLINAGLVGKQELSILVGDALETLKSGDTVQGNVDQDFSDIGRNLTLILEDVDTLKNVVGVFMDSLKEASLKHSLKSIQNKWTYLSKDFSLKLKEWKTELEISKENVYGIQVFDTEKKENLKQLLLDLDQSFLKLEALKENLEGIHFEVSKEGNLALALSEKSELFEEIDKTIISIEKLIQKIKKAGLSLNIDFF